MTLTTQQRADAAYRLIAASGASFDQQLIVHNIGVGTEDDASAVWVTGDWNDITRWNEAEHKHDTLSTMPTRLFTALDRIGVECEWYDEHDSCSNCYKLIRTQPNSYMWQAPYCNESGEYLCSDCVTDYAELDQYVNDVTRVITWANEADMNARGYVRFEPSHHQTGFHEGMNAQPADVYSELRSVYPDAPVVFLMDEQSQFYMEWSAFYRPDVCPKHSNEDEYSDDCAYCDHELELSAENED